MGTHRLLFHSMYNHANQIAPIEVMKKTPVVSRNVEP